MSRKPETRKINRNRKRTNTRGKRRTKKNRKKRINIFKVIRLLFIIILIVVIVSFSKKHLFTKKIDYRNNIKYYEQTDYNSRFRAFNNSLFLNRIKKTENNINEKLEYDRELSSLIDDNEESYILSQLYRYLNKEKIDIYKISLYVKTDKYTLKLNENKEIKFNNKFFVTAKIVSELEKNNINLNEMIKFNKEDFKISSKIYNKNTTEDTLSNLLKNYIHQSDDFSKRVINRHIKEKIKLENNNVFEIENKKLSMYVEDFISYNQSKYKNDIIYSGLLDNNSEYFLNNHKPSNFENIILTSKENYLEVGKYSYKTGIYYSIYTNGLPDEVIKNIGYIIINSIDKVENIRTLYY